MAIRASLNYVYSVSVLLPAIVICAIASGAPTFTLFLVVPSIHLQAVVVQYYHAVYAPSRLIAVVRLCALHILK